MPFRLIITPNRYLSRPRVSIGLVPHKYKPDPYVSVRLTGEVIRGLGWHHMTCLVASWDAEMRHLMLSSGSDTNPSARALNIRGGGQAGEVRWARIGQWKDIVPEKLAQRTAVEVVSSAEGSLVINLGKLTTP